MSLVLTDENFGKEINGADKPILVDFFAAWCEPCSALGPILEKVAKNLEGKFVLVKADVDTMPKTSQKLGIDRIPMVVLFDKGKTIDGFVGVRTEEFIKEWLENAIKNSPDNPQEEKNKELINWSGNYAKGAGFKLNPDRKVVEGVVNGLLANEKKYGKKYCPCRRITGDREKDSKNICPCHYHLKEIEKDGHCFCGLFVK